MIEVKNLYHDYEGKGKPAVQNVSFGIENGRIFGFLGPSGAGKSTVQNIMTKIIPIQQGDVFYDGQNIRDLDRDFLNKVGYSFEHPNVYSKLTGYENLKFYAKLYATPTEDPEKLLNMVGLGASAHKRAGRYSKGMKQRLVFARSIINNPQILFLDEPLSGLDPSTADVLKEIIRAQRKRGCTILLTTHDMHAADELCDTVAFLNEGRLIAMDSPRNLKLKYATSGLRVEFRQSDVNAPTPSPASAPAGAPSAPAPPNQSTADPANTPSTADPPPPKTQSKLLNLENPADRAEFNALYESGRVETVHSQEASLEAIFKELTGRGLSE